VPFCGFCCSQHTQAKEQHKNKYASSVNRFVVFVAMCHAHTINAFHWLDIPFCFRTTSAGWKWTRLFNGTDGQTGKHIEK
jgi:hypothetical protein